MLSNLKLHLIQRVFPDELEEWPICWLCLFTGPLSEVRYAFIFILVHNGDVC